MTMVLNDGTAVRFDKQGDGSSRVVLMRPGACTALAAAVPGDYDSPWPLYIPFTKRDPRTVAGSPRNAQWFDVSSSPDAYYALMNWIWAKGETFVIVEHDVVCRPDIIEAFETCPEPWCSFTYGDICCQDERGWSPCMDAWRNMIGCTRFRAELVRAVPDAVSSILPGCPGGCTGHEPHWDWHLVCNYILDNVREKNFTHHWHWPGAEHHHMLPPKKDAGE